MTRHIEEELALFVSRHIEEKLVQHNVFFILFEGLGL